MENFWLTAPLGASIGLAPGEEAEPGLSSASVGPLSAALNAAGAGGDEAGGGTFDALAHLAERLPWWAYSHRGVQVWYPSPAPGELPAAVAAGASTGGATAASGAGAGAAALLPPPDPELDFDREVYPLGLSPTAGTVVGVSQRAVSAGSFGQGFSSGLPQSSGVQQADGELRAGSGGVGEGLASYSLLLHAQPVLPCLLRHLLQVRKRKRREEGRGGVQL